MTDQIKIPAHVPVIAIDGPTASGKGTVAQKVAEHFGFHYLDSGALYRLVGLASFKEGVALTDESTLSQIAKELPVVFQGDRIFLNKQDVTDDIRQEEMGKRASAVGAIKGVRSALVDRQRAFLQAPGLVADGRDMASVIFPDAVLKVFLTASVDARADRRYKQLIAKGFSANIATLTQDLRERDERDTQRADAPLTVVSGARMLDTTQMTVEQAVNQVIDWYKELPAR
jgi:cytidylate kinase